VRWLAGLGCALVVAAQARPATAEQHAWLRVGDSARVACGTAPPGWQHADFDDRSWVERTIVIERHDGGAPTMAPVVVPGAAGGEPARLGAPRSPPSGSTPPTFAVPSAGSAPPTVSTPATGSTGGATAPVDAGVPVCGARFARWHFQVGSELARLRTITLRIRYTHGFAAYVNGTELARRRLEPGAAADALATDVHGPEFERFTLPAAGLLHAGDNVLAVEVHPRSAGRDTTVELSLGGDEGPRIVRGPYLLGLRETEATIVFDTDLPTAASLVWGPTERYGASASDAIGTHHILRMTRLRPATVYHYRVRADSNAAAPDLVRSHNDMVQTHNNVAVVSAGRAASATLVESADAAFHTPPESGRPLRFAVYGDVRSGHDVHLALNQALIEEQPDLAVLTGDLVDRGSDEGDWERFFELAGPLLRQLSVFPAIGNHEYAKQGRGLGAFMQLFRLPIAAADEPAYYSFDVSGAHFVALDSNQYKAPRQLAWFEHDLREARRRRVRAIFVYAHEGPASAGMHGDNSVCARDYVPIMERYRVSMFFGGHDHDYERGRIGALDYVVSGGGGAELRAARCGIPGRRPCPPRTALFVNDHNYVMVELLPSLFRVCPKRVDGTPIEACIQYPLRP
jgi:hypothetical protein